MAFFRWDKNSLKILNDFHGIKSRENIALLLGTDTKTVTRKCSELGLSEGRGCGKPRFWNEERCSYLIKNYDGTNAKEVAKFLGIDKPSKIYSIASKLGITTKMNYQEIDNEYEKVLKGELWKSVPELIPEHYQVSNFGRIRNLKLKRILGRTFNPNVYTQVEIEKKQHRVHRLVALAFVKNSDPINKIEVNHIDGIKGNAFANNLEWVTTSENQIHAVVTGLRSTTNILLSDSMVHEICKLLSNSNTHVSIVQKLGIPIHWTTKFYKFKNCTYKPEITSQYFSNTKSIK